MMGIISRLRGTDASGEELRSRDRYSFRGRKTNLSHRIEDNFASLLSMPLNTHPARPLMARQQV
jgi:hypothetical protein